MSALRNIKQVNATEIERVFDEVRDYVPDELICFAVKGTEVRVLSNGTWSRTRTLGALYQLMHDIASGS